MTTSSKQMKALRNARLRSQQACPLAGLSIHAYYWQAACDPQADDKILAALGRYYFIIEFVKKAVRLPLSPPCVSGRVRRAQPLSLLLHHRCIPLFGYCRFNTSLAFEHALSFAYTPLLRPPRP